jgi:hypothetical protein
MTAASRSNLNQDQERKSYHSGRELYTTVFKYIFEGMGLTSAARTIIEHYTVWDPEMAMACVEQNAMRAASMPQLFCRHGLDQFTPHHLQECPHHHKR